ncbi:MAG: oligopeptide transporter, OPT family [Ignavibacteria bacterium]|jgi:putative OPT family oligopeptide transporter|nr:oligopeptide transporter, OPT family [Ignavibacteria bacterium]
MDNNNSFQAKLPENAHRELRPGEVYNPVMPADSKFAEVTPWSVCFGLLMAIIFSAAAAYSGLKIGQVFEAAIPISIIAVGASAALKKRHALSQNVIIQSIGASSGVIVAGAVFTIPALYILQAKYPEIEVKFFQIFFSSLFGGFLGILFLIPFRKYFVKDMHGKFPFPEATATTEILITGEKGGSQAKILITSGLIGGLFEFLFSTLRLFADTFSTRVISIGATLAEKTKLVFKMSVSPLVFSFGYLIGLKYATIICVGSMLSWFVFIPLINEIGDIAVHLLGAGVVNPFAALSPEDIFRVYVRPIGIGAIAMAGMIGIAKSSSVIGSAFKLAVAGLGGKKSEKTEEPAVPRTDRDLKMSTIFLLTILTIGAIFVFLLFGVNITPFQAIVALVTLVVIAFLFTTVAANAIAIVGSNPVSGMTLMTLILSSFILVAVGLSGPAGMTSALIIGGIVCTALSMAGGFITDLKVGYWLGTTPVKQQQWKFLGTLVSAATVGVVIYILGQAYGYVLTPETPNPLVAPQANAMAAVIEPLMLPGAKVYWILYVVGALISLLLMLIGIPPLPFALGMFIPLELNTPLIVGGLLNYYMSKETKKQSKKLSAARTARGTLIASGMIAGAAIFGVIGALLLFFDIDLNTGVFASDPITGQKVAIIAFIILICYFVWDTRRAKEEDL